MPNKDLYCSITKKIFKEPVKLSCNHTFEREALIDYLETNQTCPDCKIPVTDDEELQPNDERKKVIEDAKKEGKLEEKDQYVPCLELFRSLSDDSKNEALVSKQLLTKPELMANFLWQCKFSCNTKTTINKLIDLNAFSETTINQSILKNFAHKQQIYSVSYLLLSSLEGREILKSNAELRTLIGEKLSKESLNQFLDPDTHDGVLYQLLINEIGQKILVNHPDLKNKITDDSLSRLILDGMENKNQSLKDLYDKIFPSTDDKNQIAEVAHCSEPPQLR